MMRLGSRVGKSVQASLLCGAIALGAGGFAAAATAGKASGGLAPSCAADGGAAAAPGHGGSLCQADTLCKTGSASSFDRLHCEAEAGDPEAAHMVGMLYATGNHMPALPRTAFRYLHMAASGNHRPAQRDLGLFLLQTGEPSIGSVEDGLHWLAIAASAGDAWAAVTLGMLHERGMHDVPQDLCLALLWYDAGREMGLEPPEGYIEERLRTPAGQAC